MKRTFKDLRVLLGFLFVVILIVITLVSPYIVPYDPISMSPMESFASPSAKHWFGADRFGRDIFSRVLYGTRYSVVLGLVAVGISIFLGIPLGLVAGYSGGIVDAIIMRIVDIGLSFPIILLALLIIAIIGPGLPTITIAIGISAMWPFARLIRGVVLYIKETCYVESARAIGASRMRIMYRHILPETFAPSITMATLRLADAIFVTSSLSFIGLGARPPTPEWGAMVRAGRHEMLTAWWTSTFPALAILATVLLLNVLGDGLRDVLDPRLRGKV